MNNINLMFHIENSCFRYNIIIILMGFIQIVKIHLSVHVVHVIIWKHCFNIILCTVCTVKLVFSSVLYYGITINYIKLEFSMIALKYERIIGVHHSIFCSKCPCLKKTRKINGYLPGTENIMIFSYSFRLLENICKKVCFGVITL